MSLLKIIFFKFLVVFYRVMSMRVKINVVQLTFFSICDCGYPLFKPTRVLQPKRVLQPFFFTPSAAVVELIPCSTLPILSVDFHNGPSPLRKDRLYAATSASKYKGFE